ncbi:zinc finger protein 765-like isoform X2 [Macrobrachium nipponense]|uniref:zinc finger protein 765-like isoform X2 n=1 Tax=Macrobrachium nipponense TaxID=159736 RepID=UPI0030C7EBD4
MNECDLIKVLKELKVYAQSWNKVTLKDFACQTDFPEPDNNNSVPFFYCCQFSSSGDAETQCDIPLSHGLCKSCAKSLSVENAATQCNLFKKVKDASNSVPKRIKKYDRTIKHEKDDEFLSLGVPFIPRHNEVTKGKESTITLDLGDQQDICVSIEEEFNSTYQTDLKPSCLKNDEGNVQSKQHDSNSKSKEITTYSGLEDCDDHHTFEPMDDDNHEEPNSKWNVQLTDSDKEFSYSEDEKFWQEMSKKRRDIYMRIRQKRQTRKRKKCSVSPIRMSLLQEGNNRIASNKTPNSSHLECMVTNNSTIAIQREANYSDSLTEYNDDTIKEGCIITDDESLEDYETDLSASDELFGNNDKNMYLCDVCGKQFARNYVLREHIVEMHGDHELAKKFCHRCPYCQRIYSKAKNVEYHLSLFKGPCQICGMIFSCSGLFCAHKSEHKSICRMCSRTFPDKDSYEFHMKSFHETNDIKCNFCNRRFLHHLQLNQHTMKFHNNPGAPAHILKCPECHYTTNNIQLLHMHKSRVHNSVNKWYTHSTWNETLNRQYNFEHYSESHKNPANFQCKTCHSCLTSESELIDHIRLSHSDQGTDIQQFNYGSHAQISYPCFSCQIVFTSSDELQAHVSAVHDEPMNDQEETQECLQENIYVIGESNVTVPHSTLDFAVNPPSPISNSLPSTALPPRNANVVEIGGIIHIAFSDKHML